MCMYVYMYVYIYACRIRICTCICIDRNCMPKNQFGHRYVHNPIPQTSHRLSGGFKTPKNSTCTWTLQYVTSWPCGLFSESLGSNFKCCCGPGKYLKTGNLLKSPRQEPKIRKPDAQNLKTFPKQAYLVPEDLLFRIPESLRVQYLGS